MRVGNFFGRSMTTYFLPSGSVPWSFLFRGLRGRRRNVKHRAVLSRAHCIRHTFLIKRSNSPAALTTGIGSGSLAWSQPSNVAVTFGQADAVKVLTDGNRVFPGCSQQVAQLRHGNRRAVGEPFHDSAAQVTRTSTSRNKRADLDNSDLVAEQGEQIGDGATAWAGGCGELGCSRAYPPARIVSANSALSFRSPWLSLGWNSADGHRLQSRTPGLVP